MALKLAAGTVVDDRFAIEKTIGVGGMATVYAARDRSTGQPVALKVLREADPDVRARFDREVRVISQLRHETIVAYVAHGTLSSDDGDPYLVLEWLDGHDLSIALMGGSLSVGDTLAILRRLAEALEIAHAQNVIHRDLKPSNVFLRKKHPQLATLIDFGLARGPGPNITGARVSIGTPDYMAPEQIRGEANLTPATDVYGLGCVAYECLTGRRPFRTKRAADLAAIAAGPPPRVRERVPTMPPAMDDLVYRMMATKAGERPSMADLRKHLHQIR